MKYKNLKDGLAVVEIDGERFAYDPDKAELLASDDPIEVPMYPIDDDGNVRYADEVLKSSDGAVIKFIKHEKE